jgi:hypothetical protein
MVLNPNIQMIEVAAEKLKTMTKEMVFVGGCATGLLLTDQAASPFCTTGDCLFSGGIDMGRSNRQLIFFANSGSYVAEGAGFEPAKRYHRLPVFETGAFSRSATLPRASR